jgi:hypothetical protein
MANLRLSNTSDAQGESNLKIVIENLSLSSYYRLQIFRSNGQSYIASIQGSDAGGYYSYRPKLYRTNTNTVYDFYAEAQTTSGGATVRIPESGYTSFITASPTTST